MLNNLNLDFVRHLTGFVAEPVITALDCTAA